MLAMIPIFAVDDPNRTLRYGSPIAFGQGILKPYVKKPSVLHARSWPNFEQTFGPADFASGSPLMRRKGCTGSKRLGGQLTLFLFRREGLLVGGAGRNPGCANNVEIGTVLNYGRLQRRSETRWRSMACFATVPRIRRRRENTENTGFFRSFAEGAS
jgi:hypothetical protein